MEKEWISFAYLNACIKTQFFIYGLQMNANHYAEYFLKLQK